METYNKLDSWKSSHRILWWALKVSAGAAFVGVVLMAAIFLVVLASTPLGTAAGQMVTWLLAGDQPQVTWYITRAAGLTAYLLLWVSTAWGLAVPSRIFDGMLHGTYTFDFHQFISLLSIAFLALHIGVLLVDTYAPFSLVQILVPFLSTYRPGWVGVGVLSLYIILLVTVTFYLRDKIGSKAFRTIHVFSLLGFLGAAVHGLMAGTDSVLPAVQVMYGFTFLSVVFLTAYWLASLVMKRRATASKSATRAGLRS